MSNKLTSPHKQLIEVDIDTYHNTNVIFALVSSSFETSISCPCSILDTHEMKLMVIPVKIFLQVH